MRLYFVDEKVLRTKYGGNVDVVCSMYCANVQMYTITNIYYQFIQHIENIIKLGDFFQCDIIECCFSGL